MSIGRALRVLLVGENHRAEIRGRTIAIHGLASALRDRGHDVTLVQAAAPEHRVTIDGVRMRYVATTRKSRYPLRFLGLATAGYDVVHTNDEAGVYLALRSRLGRMPLVAHFHPPHVRTESFWRANWRWRYNGLTARLARTRVAPSARLADAHAERFELDRSTLQVIPCGVREEWFKARRAPDSSVGAPLRIALVNMKGVDVALRALAALSPQLAPGVRFELYGVDRKREEHAALACQLGLAQRLRFEGFIAHAEMPQRIAGADVLLHPSRGESFGQVLAEAAALGIPAVASRTHAIPEIVGDGRTGLLCPVDDVPAFARALARLIARPDLRRRLGDAARQRAEATWCWERVVARLEDEVYGPCLERARGLSSRRSGRAPRDPSS